MHNIEQNNYISITFTTLLHRIGSLTLNKQCCSIHSLLPTAVRVQYVPHNNANDIHRIRLFGAFENTMHIYQPLPLHHLACHPQLLQGHERHEKEHVPHSPYKTRRKCYITPAFSGVPKQKRTKSKLAASPLPSRGPKRARKCYITAAFSEVPYKRGTNSESAAAPIGVAIRIGPKFALRANASVKEGSRVWKEYMHMVTCVIGMPRQCYPTPFAQAAPKPQKTMVSLGGGV